LTEAVKIVIAMCSWLWQCRTMDYTGLENFRPSTSLAFAVPALLFAAQNNLVYIAMQALDPPTFQLWACFKLIPVGILSSFVLQRRLTTVQWVALLLLALGMAVTTQSCATGDARPAAQRLRGIASLVINGCLSGLSTVFNEWLIKFQDPKAPLMFKNLQIYIFGTAVCAWGLETESLRQFTWLPLTIVLVNACAGLCVSFVLKYCDSLIKGFSTSASVLLAMATSSYLFDFELTRPFTLGTLVVCSSFYLYFGDFNRILLEATEVSKERKLAEASGEASELMEETTAPATSRGAK